MMKRNLALNFVLFLAIASITACTDKRSVCFGKGDRYADNFAHISTAKIPQENTKPYSDKKNNSKFSTFLQYVTKHNDSLLPEIKELHTTGKQSVLCLALNIYQEARGSTQNDQHGVGYVTINRTMNSNYPSTVCEVVWQKSQFSWTANNTSEILPKEQEAWTNVQKIAIEIYKQKASGFYGAFDITKGSTHFYAPKLCKAPSWARKKSIESRRQIGGHIYIKMTATD